mmetsp:Transcript_14072/g.35256  ORF Transcript_14072/g.35256 Transcript_14072/m.35256 type:complete len:347 (+) Transcript_14072:933-1973(+)
MPVVAALYATSSRLTFFFFFGASAAAAPASASIGASPPASAAGAPDAASVSILSPFSDVGAAAAAGSASSTSTTVCTLSRLTTPCRFRRTLTFNFALSDPSGTGNLPISNLLICCGIPAESCDGSAYRHSTANGSERKNVIIFSLGSTFPLGNSTLVTLLPSAAPAAASSAPSSAPAATLSQRNAMLYGVTSCTSNSRTRNAGDSIAHCSAHPRDTASVALRCRATCFPKNSSRVRTRQGVRLAAPTTSTSEISSGRSPASASAVLMGVRNRSKVDTASSSSFSRVSFVLQSTSFMRHSTFSGASGLMERIFFTFSISLFKRIAARAFWLTSTPLLPYFSLNSAAM